MEKQFSGYLLVSDVDGTLTTTNEVSKRNRAAINRFIQKGGLFTLSTGRSQAACTRILNQIPVNAPVISMNGAYISDPAAGKPLLQIYLPKQGIQLAKTVLQTRPDVGVMLVDENGYQIASWGDQAVEAIQLRQRLYQNDPAYRYVGDQWTADGVIKVIFVVEASKMAELRAWAETECPEGIYFVRTEELYLETSVNGVSKGSALARLCEQLGIPREKTAAIGDQENDREMLAFAGYSSAVEGACADLKKKVDFIAGTCENGAVADFIEFLEKIV